MFPSLGARAQSVCSDVSTRGKLSVLTINLDFAELQDRQVRLTRIADYAKTRAQAGVPIDLILLQEVVGGALVGTANSSVDLKQLLAARGLAYNLSYHLANGIPGVLTVGNAILSRCAIAFTLSQILPFVNEQLLPGVDIPLNREVMMVRISIPNAGKTNIYNTHLCANCTPSDRLKQVQVLLGFIRTIEYFFPEKTARILGGDFNTDLNISGDTAAYAAITGLGFTDSYLHANVNQCLSSSCCIPNTADIAGCTYAVDGDPYANRPPFSTGPTARIDYIFNNNSSVVGSEVVFPPPPGDFVSDHSAVLSTITLR
jgi:maltose 6'-phosphate phosphatase